MKAILYTRVSTKDQSDRGHSLPTQRAEGLAYAARHSLSVVEVLVEDSSGLRLDRPQLTRLRQLLRDGVASAVIAHDGDRLSREPLHYAILRDEWERLGVRLHLVLHGEVDLDSTGAQIIQDIRARIAKDEIKKLTERSRRGKRGKVKAGNVITAQRPPFGYRQVDGELVIDPDEGATVREIYRLYVDEQLSIRAITDTLTERGVPTRADRSGIYKKRGRGVWAKTTVRNIIANETYTGVWHWGKTSRRRVQTDEGKTVMRYTEAPRDQWLSVDVPAMVSRATWQAAQQRLGKRSGGKRSPHQYLLARRVVCSVCGSMMYANTIGNRRRKTGDIQHTRYYRCASRHQATAAEPCGAGQANADEVEARVWGWIKHNLTNPDEMLAIIEAQLAGQPDALDPATQRADIERRIAAKETALAQLMVLAVEGESERRAFEQARATIGADIATLRRELETLAAVATQRAVIEELSEQMSLLTRYQNAMQRDDEPFEVRLEWVKALGITVEVDTTAEPYKITITSPLGQWAVWQQTPPPTRYVQLPQLRVEV